MQSFQFSGDAAEVTNVADISPIHRSENILLSWSPCSAPQEKHEKFTGIVCSEERQRHPSWSVCFWGPSMFMLVCLLGCLPLDFLTQADNNHREILPGRHILTLVVRQPGHSLLVPLSGLLAFFGIFGVWAVICRGRVGSWVLGFLGFLGYLVVSGRRGRKLEGHDKDEWFQSLNSVRRRPNLRV